MLEKEIHLPTLEGHFVIFQGWNHLGTDYMESVSPASRAQIPALFSEAIPRFKQSRSKFQPGLKLAM